MTKQQASGGRPSASFWFASRARLMGPIAVLFILVVTFSLMAPTSFLTVTNATNILSQVSVLAVMAVGLTFVLLLGEIDLSVANISSFAGVAAATFFSGKAFGMFFLGEGKFTPEVAWIAILLPVILGGLMGWVSSLMLNRAGIPSFVATLAIGEIASGWALYWSQGNTLYEVPPLVKTLGTGTIGPIPLVSVVAALLLLGAHCVLHYTRFGRNVYMTGANARAAELSGVPVRAVKRNVFIISGAFGAFAGILNIGRLGSAQAELGDALLLPAIAAVVLGGTSLFGGVGGIGYTAIGLMIFGVLDNGLDQLDIDIFLKPYIRGLFLVLALVLNVFAMRIATSTAKRESVHQINASVGTSGGAEPATKV